MNLEDIKKRVSKEMYYSITMYNVIELNSNDSDMLRYQNEEIDFWTSLDLLLKTQLRKNKKR